MQRGLIPSSFFNFPRFSSFWDDEDREWPMLANGSGLSISEDDQNVYIEAQVPGIDPKDVEVTYDRGVIWIKGEAKEEKSEKSKKYYQRAVRVFSYRFTVPGNLDEAQEPEAICRNGVMHVTFKKIPQAQPRKIQVKSE